jgi:hypothetical protein
MKELGVECWALIKNAVDSWQLTTKEKRSKRQEKKD